MEAKPGRHSTSVDTAELQRWDDARLTQDYPNPTAETLKPGKMWLLILIPGLAVSFLYFSWSFLKWNMERSAYCSDVRECGMLPYSPDTLLKYFGGLALVYGFTVVASGLVRRASLAKRASVHPEASALGDNKWVWILILSSGLVVSVHLFAWAAVESVLSELEGEWSDPPATIFEQAGAFGSAILVFGFTAVATGMVRRRNHRVLRERLTTNC